MLLLTPMPARAQTIAATSFEQLRLTVRLGDAVTVVRADGQQTRGRVADLSCSTLTIVDGGRSRDVEQSEVSQILRTRPASLTTGARRGFIAGAVVGVLMGAGVATACRGCASAIPVFAAMYGGVGAGVGVGISAMLRTDDLVYAKRD